MLVQLILVGSAISSLRITEITPTSPLSDLDFGHLKYMSGLKATGADYPGTFVYSKDTLDTSGSPVGVFHFFKSEAAPTFIHPGRTTIAPYQDVTYLHAQFFGPTSKYLIFRKAPTTTGSFAMDFIGIKYDAATDTYTTDGRTSYGDNSVPLVMVGDVVVWHYIGTSSVFRRYNTASGGPTAIPNPSPDTEWNFFADWTTVVIAEWRAAMRPTGVIAFFKDTGTALSSLSFLTVADFKPRFATIDSSVPCDVNGCDVLVTENLNGSPTTKISKLRIVASSVPNLSATKTIELDVTALGILSKPTQPPNSAFFILAGSTAFHLYKIEASAFVKDNTFVSPTYTDMVDSSLAVGELNQSTYPDSVSIMALFKVSSGPDKYNVKLFKVQGTCEVANCLTCSGYNCVACKTGYLLYQASCVLPTKLPFKVRFQRPRNSLTIFQEQAATLQITKVVAADLESGKTYSCEQIGCSYSSAAEKITFTFDSQIQILQGELRISTKSPSKASVINTNRLLQVSEGEITVNDFVLMKSNALSAWVTILQLFICLLRTVGCVWLFPSHPRIAMLADYTVTLCAMFSNLLSPSIPAFDSVIQAISQVKILWFWFDNPFLKWDSQTQSCATRPGHDLAGVYCSFLDNYGQNTIGFLSILALILLLDWACKTILAKNKASGKFLLILHKYQYNFGLKFWFAKLQANQLEILMYVLISYSLADSSSKSVVGLVLATLHLAFMIATASLVTFINLQVGKIPAVSSEGAASTTPERSLTTARNLLLPSVCEVSEVARKHTRSIQPVVILIRDLAFSILTLNHLRDSFALTMIVAAIQLCYICYVSIFRYHRINLEHIGLLTIESMFLVMLILKAIAASSNMSISARADTLSPILICAVGALFLLVFVFIILTFYVRQTQPVPEPKSSPFQVQMTPLESDGLLKGKPVDQELGPSLAHGQDTQTPKTSISKLNVALGDPSKSSATKPVSQQAQSMSDHQGRTDDSGPHQVQHQVHQQVQQVHHQQQQQRAQTQVHPLPSHNEQH